MVWTLRQNEAADRQATTIHSFKKVERQKSVFSNPSEEGAEACNLAVGMFALSFEYLGVELAGKLTPKASERAEVKGQPQTLKEAFELGKALK